MYWDLRNESSRHEPEPDISGIGWRPVGIRRASAVPWDRGSGGGGGVRSGHRAGKTKALSGGDASAPVGVARRQSRFLISPHAWLEKFDQISPLRRRFRRVCSPLSPFSDCSRAARSLFPLPISESVVCIVTFVRKQYDLEN